MAIEKEQKPEFWFDKLLNSEQQKQKDVFQSRIDELKKLDQSTKSGAQELKKEMETQLSLLNLEQKVQALDGRNQDKFLADVEKIESELAILEDSRRLFVNLKSTISAKNPQLYAQIQQQFPESSEMANQGRLTSYQAIASIKPQKGENVIANFFAGIVEKLVA